MSPSFVRGIVYYSDNSRVGIISGTIFPIEIGPPHLVALLYRLFRPSCIGRIDVFLYKIPLPDTYNNLHSLINQVSPFFSMNCRTSLE